MTEMVEAVPLLGRIESGKLGCSRQPLSLAELCRGIVRTMSTASGADTGIIVTAPDELASLDANLVSGILENLLINAVKYSKPGSPISLVAAMGNGRVIFTVRDEGIGIPLEDLARVSDPFHRCGNVGEIPGTGLGLAIARRYAELHGGTLGIENTVGLGTDSIADASVSGTYRIYLIDSGSTESGKKYAMRIVRDPLHTYWFEHRQSITGPDAGWAANGLSRQFGAEHFLSTSGDTHMLDMTPGNRGLATESRYATVRAMQDAPLALGRAYSDTEANIHVTPIKKAGTTPEALDVVVNHGSFPTNHAPALTMVPATVASLAAGISQVFTTTATDSDSDTLAYYWEFDDPDADAGFAIGGSNPDTCLATSGMHTWTRAGTYLVRCTVTDMKGGKTTKSSQVTITGGLTAMLDISGTILDENGIPIAGAVVNNYNGLVTSPQTIPLVNFNASNFSGAASHRSHRCCWHDDSKRGNRSRARKILSGESLMVKRHQRAAFTLRWAREHG